MINQYHGVKTTTDPIENKGETIGLYTVLLDRSRTVPCLLICHPNRPRTCAIIVLLTANVFIAMLAITLSHTIALCTSGYPAQAALRRGRCPVV